MTRYVLVVLENDVDGDISKIQCGVMLWVMGCMGTMEATPSARPSIGQCTKLLSTFATFAGVHQVQQCCCF